MALGKTGNGQVGELRCAEIAIAFPERRCGWYLHKAAIRRFNKRATDGLGQKRRVAVGACTQQGDNVLYENCAVPIRAGGVGFGGAGGTW